MNIFEFLIHTNWFTDFPNGRTDYNSDNQPEYLGGAERGTPTSAARWRIVKFFYDSNGRMSYWLTSNPNATWDNRASETYA